MSIFRGTGGSGNSTDDSIVSAVTEQAGIATTKAGEAATSASNANTSATNAATSATTASTKATEAASSATTASTKATEANTAKTGAETAKTAAEAARDTALVHANTANNTHVQTVSGIATEVQNLDSIKTDITGVNTIKSDVTTVAGISSNVTTVAADASDIGTVATNITNVNNVGDNISNVNSVAGNATNINTVAGDASDIGTVSSNISNVNTVAGISSDVTTVAGLESKMDTVIADASDIGAVANNIDDVTTVAGINSEVDTVAGISAKVTTVADNITDVQNADTNAANASASASQAANSATAASVSATTASTKATESHASALAASNSASTATTKATEAAGSATTATTKATEASTSATNAATSATTATTKASEAASSATAASGSATTATTKASEADASANSAASSATDASNAASTWTNYYSTYLGAADAPPTADVQGNALQTGAFYYDTGAGSNTVGLYVYNGSSWVYSTNYNNVTAPYSLAQDLATNSHDISFGDNAKANFGASDDLQIYHDGNNSYVTDTGTGGLYLRGSNEIALRSSSNENIFLGLTDGSAYVYHNGIVKLQTKSTGIDVTGTVKADTHFTSSDSNATLSTSGTGGTVRLRPNGISSENGQVTVDSSGKVGIGTTSPDEKLDVSRADVGNLAKFQTVDGTNNPRLTLSTTATGVKARSAFSTGIVGSFEIEAAGGSSYIALNPNSSEAMRVKANGNVGIGTTSPSQTLDVAGNIQATGTRSIAALYDSNHYMRVEANASGGVLKGTDGGVVTTFVRSYGDSYFNGGNIGIGTTSPNSTLHVKSSGTNSQSLLRLESNSGTRAFIGSDAQDDSYLYLYDSSDTLKTAFRTDGNHSYIAGGGNFGIGTTSPSESLHVSGVARADTLRAGGGSNSAPGIAFINSTTTGLTNPAIATLGFVAGGQERIRINSVGNVAIGTSTPYEKLHVNGRVRASSVRCTSNGSYFHYAGFMGVPGIEIRHALSSSSTSLQTMIEFEHVSGGAVGSIKSNGTSTQYNTSSDERMKENIQDAGDAGAKIDAIQIRQFDWKDSNHHEDFGVIAQELQPVAPEAVSEGYTEEDMWSVDYSKLVPTLIKEIQSLRNRVAELEKK